MSLKISGKVPKYIKIIKYKKINIWQKFILYKLIYGLINWSNWDLPHENAQTDTNSGILQTLNSEFSKEPTPPEELPQSVNIHGLVKSQLQPTQQPKMSRFYGWTWLS